MNEEEQDDDETNMMKKRNVHSAISPRLFRWVGHLTAQMTVWKKLAKKCALHQGVEDSRKTADGDNEKK